MNLEALAWLERMAAQLTKGYVLSIDYGFTRAESVRFPAGTLMGYRRHTAREDVLAEAGLRDITAHVNFTALEESGAACGLATVRFETLAQTLLAAGEPDAVRGGARRGRHGGGIAPPHAAQDAALRDGRDVPGSVAEEDGRGKWGENRREKP